MNIALGNKQSPVYERLIHRKDGSLARVRFEVVEVEGQLKGRVISVEAVVALPAVRFYLPASKATKKTVSQIWDTEKKIASPFSNTEFLTSVQIRAPSFR